MYSTHSTYRRADANPSPNGATGASPSDATGANPSLRGAICANRANGPTGPTKLGSTNAPTKGFSSEGEESVSGGRSGSGDQHCHSDYAG